VYVDDIPSPPFCLHGAFIYSTEPLARVKDINLRSSTQSGVSAVLTFKDIPAGGENVGAKTYFGFEPLFADDLARCAGDRVAFVVTMYFQLF
jgi:abscisic-aldehyde oxidase